MKSILLRFWVIIITSLFIVGCGEPSSKMGLWEVDYSKRVVPMKNGVKDGVEKEYYHIGQIARTTTWKNGKKNGPYREYNSLKGHVGEVYTYVEYKDDKPHGKAIYHDKFSGKKLAEKIFDNGKLVKSIKYFLYNGKIFEIKHWNGPYVKYQSDGKIRLQGQYKNGKKDGVWKWYGYGDPHEVFSIARYKNGVEVIGKETQQELKKIEEQEKKERQAKKKYYETHLDCGGISNSYYDKLSPTARYKSAAMTRGKGIGDAKIYIANHGRGKISQQEARRYCIKMANMVKMPCNDAEAYLSGCLSGFGY